MADPNHGTREGSGSPLPGRSWEPEVGEVVACRTADGLWLRKVVRGPGGVDFPCWNVSWENPPTDMTAPWPIEDVRPLAEHPDALDSQGLLAHRRGV